ncbi:MAG: aminotransferase class V-fold PLP-dependent enzyme [Bryobacteraceae bacterium]
MSALWEQHRAQFPVTANLIYLNHAAVAPLSKPAADAMAHLAADACHWGSLHYDGWLETYEGLRVGAARMIGAHRDEIAVVKNTSEGIATVALGLDWRAGDKVVAFREEFPANYYPWQRLAPKGVRVEWLSIYDPLDRIDAACDGAHLLAISYVNYLSGHRVDLDAIGEICRRRGTFFFVDAIQGLGAFPIDVRRAGIHALAADGHKWLLGPEGCGVLYIQKEFQDSIEPVEFGWTNVAAYADYASRDMALRSDAGRYECGTLNTIGIYGLRASFDYLNGIGVEQIRPAVLALSERMEAGVRAKGCEVLGTGSDAHRSGIVSFRKEGIDSRMIVKKLRENGIVAAPRQGWVRASPHFYIAPAEIDRMLELIP